MFKKQIYHLFHWETWHWFVKYVPIIPFWLWHCLRSGSLWFFTASNPDLTFGGFLGETKREMYNLLPKGTYPKSIYLSPPMHFDQVQRHLTLSGIAYPVAVKPDIGMMGYMFRKVENERQLLEYHEVMSVDYILQEFVNYPVEVSVFYYRYPGEEKGRITGFLKKEAMQVTGNGKSTLGELILGYNRVAYRLQEMRAKHRKKLNDVIPEGEVFRLSEALNLSRGGLLISLEDQKDASLLQLFDALSHGGGSFYFGRYDIRCLSVEDLKKGINFSILEYNGCGAEPHHIYGNGNNLLEACRILLEHWNALYKISKLNNSLGIKYWDYRSGIKFIKRSQRHFRQLKKLDATFEFDPATVSKGWHHLSTPSAD